MHQPIHTCMVKAIATDTDRLEHGPDWAPSRRGMLKVFGDRLECGDWAIPYEAIDHTRLLSVRSTLIPGYVLQVVTGGAVYQFGLNPGGYWKGDLPFEVERATGKVRYTLASIALRVLVGLLAYVLWERFG